MGAHAERMLAQQRGKGISTSKIRNGISLDFSEFIEKLDGIVEFSDKELQSIYNRSMGSAVIQTVVKEARRDLKAWLADSEHSTSRTVKSIGIKSARRKALVLAGGRFSQRYGGELMHILDGGTDERNHKSGHYTGRVLGLQFFKAAYEAKRGDMMVKFEDKLRDNYLKKLDKKLSR